MLVNRRRLLNTSLTAATLAASLPLAACGGDDSSVDVAELIKPGAVPDKILGKSDAPVTVIEYSSLGCPHCAAFHKSIFPYLKTTYIDTGKVRFISRDFPLDQVAAAAAMLARCAPEDKYFDMAGLFFETQEAWHVSENQTDALFGVVKQAGFTRESFETCLKDQTLLDGITATRSRASDKFKVNATPTFFINGKRADRFQSIPDVDQTLSALVKS